MITKKTGNLPGNQLLGVTGGPRLCFQKLPTASSGELYFDPPGERGIIEHSEVTCRRDTATVSHWDLNKIIGYIERQKAHHAAGDAWAEWEATWDETQAEADNG